MKIIPAPGYALIQIVAPDFQERNGLFQPKDRDKKDTMFSNRVKILALGEPDPKSGQNQNEWLKEDDIVVLASYAFQLGVNGAVRRDDGQWVDVGLVPRSAFVGKIEGDYGEDLQRGGSLISTIPANFDAKMEKFKIN